MTMNLLALVAVIVIVNVDRWLQLRATAVRVLWHVANLDDASDADLDRVGAAFKAVQAERWSPVRNLGLIVGWSAVLAILWATGLAA